MRLAAGEKTVSLVLDTPMDISYVKHELGVSEVGDPLQCKLVQLQDSPVGWALEISRMPEEAPEKPAKKAKKP